MREPHSRILVISPVEDDKARAEIYCEAIFDKLPDLNREFIFTTDVDVASVAQPVAAFNLVVVHLNNTPSDLKEVVQWIEEWANNHERGHRLGIVCAIDAGELNEAMQQWRNITSSVAGKTGIDFFWHYLANEPTDNGIVQSSVQWLRKNRLSEEAESVDLSQVVSVH